MKIFRTRVQLSPSPRPILIFNFLPHLKKPRINNQIIAREVRVVSEKESLGIMPLEKALQHAKDQNLDLIEVSSNTNPPVCKIMDFGKYLYQFEKKERTKRKGAKIGRLKNVRISLRISEHDIETKIKQTKKFLLKGYKVRIEVFLKGREKSLGDLAKEKIETMIKKISEEVIIKKESEAKRNPRGMEIIISKK